MALTTTQVSQLYVALFGRASEGEGNKNWVNHNKNMIDTAALMLNTSAAKNYFGEAGKTNYGFVEVIYKNTLGFDNAAHIAAWAANLDNGMSKAELVTLLLEEALSSKYAGTAPQNQLKNRIDVSDYMANNVETVAAENVASTQFQSLVHPNGKLVVTDDKSTVSSAESAIDEMSGGTVIDGETFTLTTSAGEVFEGTDKNDLIEGTSSSLSATRTLDQLDQIDGGKGVDTANIALEGSFAGFTKDKGFMKNVEKVNLTNDSTIARDFSGQGVSGVTDYNLKGAVNLSSLEAISNVNAEARTEDLTIGYTTKAVEGTKDKLTLGVKDFGTKASTSPVVAEKAVTVNVAGVETVDLKVAGTNVLNLTGLAAKDITLAGSGDTKINSLATATKTFDASAATAKLDLTIGAAATGMTKIATGSGDDKISVDFTNVTANAKISGGEGKDTLVLTGSSASTLQLSQSGIETVELKNTAALTMSLKNTTGVENIVVSGATAASSLSNVGAGDINVALEGALVTAATLTSDHSGTTTINVVKPAATATVAAPTANDADVTLTKSSSLELNVAEKMNYTGTVTATEASSVKVALTGATTSASIIAAKATNVEIANVDTNSTLTLTAAKAVNLNVSNAKNLDLTGSTLTAVEALTSTGAGNLTVTDLDKLNSANITNTGTVILGATGGLSGQTYATTVNVEGAKGFTIGAMKTNNANITLNATSVVGNVVAGNIDAGTANVSVLAAATGTVNLGTIAAKNVSVDASGILGATTYAKITADNLTFKGSELKANNLVTNTVELTGATSNVSLTGGLDNDTFKLDTTATTTTAKTIVVTGDLGLGTDSVAINLSTSGAKIVNISGLADYDTAVITAGGTGLNTITGGTGADTIISAGATADVLTGGTGADKFVVGVATAAVTAAGAKTITDFGTGDKVSFHATAGSVLGAGTYAEGANAVADFAAALTAANAVLTKTDGTKEANAQQVGNDTYVFFNDGVVTGADAVVKLTGVALADVVATDFLA